MSLVLTPTQHYMQDLETRKISPDPAQSAAIKDLQEVYDNMVQRWEQPAGPMPWLLNRLRKPEIAQVHGLYFWGGVGRGKTYLMDLFYQCLPGERKLRMHFHRFMQMVHRRLYEQKGRSNPLTLVAKSIAEQVDIICFDEFFVSDIGDAMILANLLEALLGLGVTLIATSNIAPEHLYENGLQREKFLPAIALLEKYTKIVNVDGGYDYRLRSLEKAEIFHSPLDKAAEIAMSTCFEDLSAGQLTKQDLMLEILGRDILARHWSEGLVWFEFEDICGGPRSAADYIEIAQLFHTVILVNIPILNASNDDSARRFISLVDEFYDHSVKLILSAEAPLELLYQGDELAFPFERTRSRLLEMQSHEYLARQHMP
ncbi:cell division protein ZapE [Gammaproteobacteria bacterium]|nr:cell division protein ZapE [Gammaproteobacteria bacterium]